MKDMSAHELDLDNRDARMLAAVNFGLRVDNMIRATYRDCGNAIAVARHYGLSLDDVLFIVQHPDRRIRAGGVQVVTRTTKPVR